MRYKIVCVPQGARRYGKKCGEFKIDDPDFAEVLAIRVARDLALYALVYDSHDGGIIPKVYAPDTPARASEWRYSATRYDSAHNQARGSVRSNDREALCAFAQWLADNDEHSYCLVFDKENGNYPLKIAIPRNNVHTATPGS